MTSESSPRALRTMAIVRWLLLALVALVAAYSVWTFWGPSRHEHAEHRVDRYYCPMHPEIRSPDPGECPICHMRLEPIPEGRQSQKSSTPSGPSSVVPPDVTTVTLSEEKQQAVGLGTMEVESAALGDRLRVPGIVSAPETGRSEVRVRAPGFVEQVLVRQTGAKVSRGQPLALVFSPEIYRAEEEFLAASRWSAAGSGEGTASGAAADLAAASRRALELLGMSSAEIDEVARTQKPIKAIAVRAPAAGFVTRFNAILGSRAEPDTVLYEIADLSSVWVIASVHEREVGALVVGKTARFLPSGGHAEALEGRIDLIEPLLEESTRTTRVRLVLKNTDGHLRPGQYGDVLFDLPEQVGLFVPRDAVIRTGEHEYVYVALGKDRFEPRLVKTGRVREGRVEVLSGLEAGWHVVVRGGFMLDSESRLQASLAGTSGSARPASAEHGSHGAPP